MSTRETVPVWFGYDGGYPFILAKDNAKAKMVGRKIYVRARLSAFMVTGLHNMRRLIKHELGHVRQYDRLGRVRFTAMYAWWVARLYLRHWDAQKVHDLHPMELEAKAYALQPWTREDLLLLSPYIQAILDLEREDIV